MVKLRALNIFKIYDIYSYGFIHGLGLTKSEIEASQLNKIRKVLFDHSSNYLNIIVIGTIGKDVFFKL